MTEHDQHDESHRRSGYLPWLGLVAAVLVLVGYLAWRFPDALSTTEDYGRLGYLVALLAVGTFGIVGARRLGLGRMLRYGAIWVSIALVVALGYSFRHELGGVADRLRGELLPHEAQESGARELQVRRDSSGHYRLEAEVDGVAIRFLVDTGASDVVLSPADARRLDIDLDTLRFSQIYATANGTVRGAPLRLGAIVIGPLRVTDFPASVNEAEMGSSLLGMAFLERLRSFEFRDQTLFLRW